ncbi:unnamed protein product, partial [Mycena citricolor]
DPAVYRTLTTRMSATDESNLKRQRANGNEIWSAESSVAQNYDQGVVDGWRSEMYGLLIFAGLFSGVIAMFMTESHKMLSPDSGTQTLALLSEITQLLAGIANGTATMAAAPPAPAFSPSFSALLCNSLWFASLALSLASALVAILVEQWAREYQHGTSVFPSPPLLARAHTYLYPSLRRFDMHAAVGIPLVLLNGALAMFLAGLVAFLAPSMPWS